MQFDIAVHGIDYNVLQGSLKFMIEGVEYGFPVNVLKDEIAVDVPALDEIIKKGLIDGSEVECKLDIFGEGFYMSPWEGQFKLITPARVEATMVYSDSSRGSKPSVTLTNKSKDTSKQTIVKEGKKEVKEEKEIKTESPLFDGNETQQMLRLLEKLVNQRHVKESTNEFNGDEDNTIEDELDSVTDEIKSKYEKPDKDDSISVKEKCNKEDDGVTAKVGNKDVLIDDPVDEKPIQKETKRKQPKSKYARMKEAVDKALNRDPSFKHESREVKTTKRRRLLKALMIKESKLHKTTKVKTPIKKKTTVAEKKPYRVKEPGEIIHEADIIALFNSVGMTSEKSQKRLLERARDLGNTEPEDIYATIKKFIGPSQATSALDFIQEKLNK